MTATTDRKIQDPAAFGALAARVERVDPAVSPSRLGSRAGVEGYPTRPLNGARYLEISNGNGANLMAQAAAFPQVLFTGTSLALDKAIETFARPSNIQNIEIGSLDLGRFEAAPGTYDFIAADDVFSTASTAERMALLVLVKRQLTEQGVACIGVDVYPGWRMVEDLRDVLCLGLADDFSAEDKVHAVRERMVDLAAGIRDGRYADRRHHLADLRHFAAASDAEIYRTLLDPARRACDISEFLAMAGAAELQAIGDIDPLKTNPVVLPAAQRPAAGTTPGFAELSTAIDQYANTRRRHVLLVHAGREKTDAGAAVKPADLFITSALTREDTRQSDAELLRATSATFNGPVKYQTSSRVDIIALALLERHRQFPVRVDRLAGHVTAALRQTGETKAEPGQVGRALSELCRKLLPTGGFITHLVETRAVNRPAERPTLAPLARLQVRAGADQIASLVPHYVRVDTAARFILERFDGTQSVEQITEDVMAAVARKAFTITGKETTPEARARATVMRVLAHATRSGLMIR